MPRVVRVVRGDYFMAPDAVDLARKKKEDVEKAIDRIREHKKLRKKEEKKSRRKRMQ